MAEDGGEDVGVGERGEGVKVGDLFLFFVVASLWALATSAGFLVCLLSVGETGGRVVVFMDDTALPPAFVDSATERTMVFIPSHFLAMGGGGSQCFNSRQNRVLRWLRW